jgi:hypothetical protein
MQETPEQYTERISGYIEGKDPLTLLPAAPRKLAALLGGKSRRQLMRRPAPKKWSVAEIAAHLADAEMVTGWRLRQILNTNGVSIEAYDQDVWAATLDYAHREPKQSYETFRVLRSANMAVLNVVPRRRWQNHGVHNQLGKQTVAHFVRMVAAHDVNHLRQIERILNG